MPRADAGDAGGQTLFLSCCWRGWRVDRDPVAEWRCGGMGVFARGTSGSCESQVARWAI